MSVQVLTKLLFDEKNLVNVSVVLIVVVRALLCTLDKQTTQFTATVTN